MLLVWKVVEEDEIDLSKNDSHEAACEDLLPVCLSCDESDQWSGIGNMANHG